MRETIRVLHVDDDPDVAELAATFLERESDRFSVETATTASEGLARLPGEFDCVISDYDMPETNGIEFLESVREAHPELPFILFTGKGSEDVASDAISAGVTDYLQKESGTSQYTVLANRITNAVAQYRSEQALEASRRRFSLFFEESPLGVVEWSEAFEIERLNESAMDILGYESADLAGASWDAITPASAQSDADDPASALQEHRDGHRSVVENVRGDGERIVCEWHHRVVTDDDGEITAAFSQFWEITEQHRRRQRQERQRDALVELATDEAVVSGDFEAAVERITETAADVLDVSRANVWLFNDAGDTLRCVDSYDRLDGRHESGTELRSEDYPAYIDALDRHRSIAASDASTDPRTGELAAYLDEHDVGALLDGTFRSDGEVVGVVCHENVGDSRSWTDDERQFAANVAGIVGRALRNHERTEQQRALEFQRSVLEAQQASILDGLLVVDEDRELVSYNDQFLDLWDLPDAAVSGSDDVFDAMSARVVDSAAFREVTESLHDQPSSTSRNEIELADGRVLEWYSTPVTGADGAYYGRLWMYRDVTERRDRETRLSRSNARLEALFEDSPDMINVHDTAGNIIDPNPRLCEKTGYDASQLTEMKVWDLDAEMAPDEATDLWTTMEHAEQRRVEGKFRCRDGSVFPVEVHIRRVTLDGEDRFVASARDISDRRARERELERYESIVETIDDVAFVVNDEWTIEYVNEAGLHYADVPKAAAEGVPVMEFAREFIAGTDGIERFERALDRAFDPGSAESPERLELALDLHLGRLVFEYQLSPIVETDAVTGVVITMRDITERKERERDLLRTKERLDTIVSNVPIVLFALDSDGTFTLSEGKGLEALGLQPGQVVGESVFDIYDAYPEIRRSVERALDGEQFSSIHQFDGLIFETTYQPVFDEDGAVAGVIGVSTDITERRRRQQALERQNERLDRFTAVVSHDLRNPLNVASGQLALAQRDCESPHLDGVADALDRMDTLIDDLLTLAHEGEREGDPEPVDLAAAVRSCWDDLPTGDAALRVDADRAIVADSDRLRQLLTNLLRNSVEHGSTDPAVTGSSGIESRADVTVTVGTLADGFYVADDGPGIPPEEREQVFESGYSNSADGTGFGLSIVAEIADASEWEVAVSESSTGGARFEVTGVDSAER